MTEVLESNAHGMELDGECGKSEIGRVSSFMLHSTVIVYCNHRGNLYTHMPFADMRLSRRAFERLKCSLLELLTPARTLFTNAALRQYEQWTRMESLLRLADEFAS